MFNQSLFNGSVFNFGSPFAVESVTDDIIFDGMGMQNAYIVTSYADYDNFPNIALETYQNPVIDGGGVLNRRFQYKDITFRGVLLAASADALNDLIDLFKRKTSKVEGNLDIKINGVYRRAKSSCISSNILPRRHFDITRCRFEITLRTLEPFHSYEAPSTVSEEGISTPTHNIEFSYTGNAVSYPVTYIIFGTVAGTGEVSLALNGKQIVINEAITTGDILVLDGVTKSVKINNTEVDYTGTFPNLEFGSNLFEFAIDGTYTADITILYKTNRL